MRDDAHDDDASPAERSRVRRLYVLVIAALAIEIVLLGWLTRTFS